jgi:hypothetical protein
MSFISSRIIEGVNRLVRCANLKAVGFMLKLPVVY